MLIARVDVVRIGQGGHGTQLATQIFPVRICHQLVRVLAVVANPIVQIVIDDAGARSERNLSVVVRKEVKSVMMMVLDDAEVGMKYHPVDEVRELAEPSSYAA